MNDWLFASILKKQVQIGETVIPFGLIVLVATFLAIVMSLNLIYLKRYNKIMAYLRGNYPEIYERVRRKPNVGPFYSTAFNSSKPLTDLAKQSRQTSDVHLRERLSNFVKFNQSLTWISSIVIVTFVLFSFIVLIFLLY